MNPAQQSALYQVTQWIEDCNVHHHCCTPPAIPKANYGHTPLPTRVLDVGTLQTPQTIKLLETNGRCGSYVTLSHCWGNHLPLTTTVETLSARIHGINHELLPKTFLDAVFITRKVGIRYIWIDALCIIQDDFNDWEREASTMASIYANSYLTVAASSSPDGSHGILNTRSRSDAVEITHNYAGSQTCKLFVYSEARVASPSTHADDWLESEPLNYRAWTLQERYLSTRILHYAKSQMFYECQNGVMAENGESSKPVYRNRVFHQFDGWEKDNIKEWTYHEWTEILTEYSARRLTKCSDKLPALSGLASLFAKGSKDRYCAGLWWRDLRRGLFWRVKSEMGVHMAEQGTPIRYEQYTAPSWSPLSVNTSIEYPLVETLSEWGEQLIVPLEYHVTMTGESQFGAIKADTWLRLRAHLHPLFLKSTNPVSTRKDEEWRETIIHIGLGTMEGRAYLDSANEGIAALFALFLKKPERSALVQMIYYSWHGLILQRMEGIDGEYGRVGLVNADPGSYSGRDDVDGALLGSTMMDFNIV